MSDAFFLRWLKDHASCSEVVRSFGGEYMDLLKHLKQKNGRGLQFRCEIACGPGSGCESSTLGFFSGADDEIVLCDCPGKDHFVSDMRSTLHHELIHATELRHLAHLVGRHTIELIKNRLAGILILRFAFGSFVLAGRSA